MPERRIAIAADHAGYELKETLRKSLTEWGFEVSDLGTHDAQSVDYPDYAALLADAVKKGRIDRGVLVCGSGIGICMAANRFSHIRAAQVHDVTSARLARLHNDANVICLGARLIGGNVAHDCVKAFLETEFEGGRHQGRVDKLARLGNGNG